MTAPAPLGEAYTVPAQENEDYWGRDLDGPDGWTCRLGEPEDCNWIRDGRHAVVRLNEQHQTIASLTDALQSAVDAAQCAVNAIMSRSDMSFRRECAKYAQGEIDRLRALLPTEGVKP